MSVYALYLDGDCVDTCRASSEEAAADWFADTWDVNDDRLHIEEDIDERGNYDD